MENDYELALLLQDQFNHETEIDTPKQNLVYAKKEFKNETKSLTDPSWELIDPTPNIHVLFMAFNEKYFWNKLLAVCVSWSKRMTSCAGICSYQGRGGLCHITLSEPLLKLRPRKDLIETLLHEMIHAFLFVTHNNKDRDGHGPEFHKHMYRINAEAGTKITVYHSFHDEVLLYQQHWWRCNGPCQQRKPYFGMVRRATNRAPGPNDRWWAEHQRNCDGTFIKVKEPETFGKKKTQKENKPVDSKNDIRSFYPVLKNNNINTLNTVVKKNSSSTIVITKTNGTEEKEEKNTAITAFEGTGHILSTNTTVNNEDYTTVRNYWINKFPREEVKKRPNSETNVISPKRIKPDEVNCPVCQIKLLVDEVNSHLDLCLLKDDTTLCTTGSSKETEEKIMCLVCNQYICKRTLNEHLDECVNDSVFNNSDVIEISSDNEEVFKEQCDNSNDKNNSYNCPVCLGQYPLSEMSLHLDQCLSTETAFSSLFDQPF